MIPHKVLVRDQDNLDIDFLKEELFFTPCSFTDNAGFMFQSILHVGELISICSTWGNVVSCNAIVVGYAPRICVPCSTELFMSDMNKKSSLIMLE